VNKRNVTIEVKYTAQIQQNIFPKSFGEKKGPENLHRSRAVEVETNLLIRGYKNTVSRAKNKFHSANVTVRKAPHDP